jgi:hypothetical protein
MIFKKAGVEGVLKFQLAARERGEVMGEVKGCRGSTGGCWGVSPGAGREREAAIPMAIFDTPPSPVPRGWCRGRGKRKK